MVGPGGTTALWCRWYGTQVRQRLGEPPRVTRAGAGQEACAGGHGGGGGLPGGRGTIIPITLADTFPGWRASVSWGRFRAHRVGPQEQEGVDRTGGVTAAGGVAGWRDEAALPALTSAPS
jgi:hypothetical protein